MLPAVLLAALAACGPAATPATPALRELERLAFVPPGESLLPGWPQAAHSDVSLPRALLVDRFEATRGDCLSLGVPFGRQDGAAIGAAATPPSWSSDAATDDPSRLNWPAWLTYAEAEELARRRGMRLPTAAEWTYVATGGRNLAYPYHATSPQKGFANTQELGLGRPAPVGSFENGKSQPFGCYDLLGNVWEWVSDAVPGYLDPAPVAAAVVAGLTGDSRSSVMGGSYLSRLRRTYGRKEGASEGPDWRFHAQLLPRRTLRPDVGVRLVADAETYLLAQAPGWGRGATAERRVREVGASWAAAVGRDRVASFLAVLVQRPGSAPSLRWLLAGAEGSQLR